MAVPGGAVIEPGLDIASVVANPEKSGSCGK